jgi:hypothetical protein
MLNDYFYNGTIKTITYGFGTLFNNIYVKKTNNANEVVSMIKVPIRYGPTQKFLSRLKQSPEDLNNPVQITLPRMSFEMTSLSYDSKRKASSTVSFLVPTDNGETIKRQFLPVPYVIGYNLYIMTKLTDDVWQIIEQIMPYFTPSHALTLNLVPDIREMKDVHYTLNSIDINEDYEGDFSERVTFIYTLAFSANAMFYKPTYDSDVSSKIIENVSIGFVAGGSGSTNRDLTYTVGPKATKSYDDNVATSLNVDIGLVEFTFELLNASSVNKGDYITIDNETMSVLDIEDNTVTVRRGEYGTPITNHVLGSPVKLITVSDNSLIPFGDEFGINLENN